MAFHMRLIWEVLFPRLTRVVQLIVYWFYKLRSVPGLAFLAISAGKTSLQQGSVKCNPSNIPTLMMCAWDDRAPPGILSHSMGQWRKNLWCAGKLEQIKKCAVSSASYQGYDSARFVSTKGPVYWLECLGSPTTGQYGMDRQAIWALWEFFSLDFVQTIPFIYWFFSNNLFAHGSGHCPLL